MTRNSCEKLLRDALEWAEFDPCILIIAQGELTNVRQTELEARSRCIVLQSNDRPFNNATTDAVLSLCAEGYRPVGVVRIMETESRYKVVVPSTPSDDQRAEIIAAMAWLMRGRY